MKVISTKICSEEFRPMLRKFNQSFGLKSMVKKMARSV